jgi:glycosidase
MNYIFGGRTIAFTAGDRVDAEVAAGLPFPVSPPLDAVGYGDAIEGLLALYPRYCHLANLNLLGSHDTARVLTVASDDVESVILSTLLNFTFPGAPSIYYGDEIGMSGGNDPGSRGAFPWERTDLWNERLLEAHRSLIALRKDHRVLRHGNYRKLPVENGSSLYAFAVEDEEERLLIAVNVSDLGASATISGEEIGAEINTLWGSGGLRSTDGDVNIALRPRSGVVWSVPR